MKSPLFTVSLIMANYNHAHYLKESLPLIFSQSRKPDEIIVIDDCSTDNSLEVLTEFSKTESRLKVLKNERNRGANYSASVGFEASRGSHICFHSADDKLMPGFFEKNMGLLEQNPEAGLSCSFASNFNSDTGVVEEYKMAWSDSPRYFSPQDLAQVDVGGDIPGHTCIYRKDAIVEAGGLLSQLEWHSDWYMNHVIAARRGICFIPERLSLIRVIDQSYSTGRHDWSRQKEIMKSMIDMIFSPKYRDVIPFFQSAKILSHMSEGIGRLIIEEGATIDPRKLGATFKMLRSYQQEKIINEILSAISRFNNLLTTCVG